MKILVDEEGRKVVTLLIDNAIRSGGVFRNMQEAVVVAQAITPIQLPDRKDKPEKKPIPDKEAKDAGND